MRLHQQQLRRQIVILFLLSFTLFSILVGVFYCHMYKLLRQKEENHMESLVDQLYEYINNSTERILSYADMISTNKYTIDSLTETDPSLNYNNTQILRQIIPGIIQNSSNVYNVILLNLHDVFMTFYSDCYVIVDKLDKQYPLFSDFEFYTGFTGVIDDRSFYAYIKPIIQPQPNTMNFSSKIGTCLILNPTEPLQSIIDQSNISDTAYFMVLDADNQPIVTNTKNRLSEVLLDLNFLFNDHADAKQSFNILGQQCLVIYKSIPDINWKIVSVIPEREIYKDLSGSFLYNTLFALLISLIFVIWYHQVSYGILRPIYQIIHFMSLGADHSLHHRIQINRNNELGILIRQINTLLDEISELTSQQVAYQAQIYHTELEKKKAELSALQSQINPHFLYNTLENLKGYGYILHCPEIIEITNSLSFIMRYCIKGTETVTVREEMDCVKKYLNIIKIRFDDRIACQYNISDDTLDAKVPRFILQPIVENAVYHGLESLPAGGLLEIRVSHDDAFLYLIVIDNGVGITAEVLNSLQEMLTADNIQDTLQPFADRSIGLININNRLRGTYGSKCHLTIESTLNQGTTVVAIIPWESGSPGL